jgi:hypothetical protein
MKSVSLFKRSGALNSIQIFRAFEYSLTNAGYKVVDNSLDADIAVIWSNIWYGRMSENRQIWNHFKKQKKDVIILEVGAVKRGITWKIGLNGLGPKNLIYELRDTDSYGFKLKEWQTGNKILICGQHDKSNFWEGMPPQSQWIEQTVRTIQKHTDMKIVIRPHPRCPIKLPKLENIEYLIPKKIPNTYDDYDLTFDDYHCVISWSGSSGPLAIVNGVPTFCGPDSFAYATADSDVNNILNPKKPNREEWFHHFLSSEYTLPDIKMGMPLKILTNYI